MFCTQLYYYETDFIFLKNTVNILNFPVYPLSDENVSVPLVSEISALLLQLNKLFYFFILFLKFFRLQLTFTIILVSGAQANG